MMGDFLGLSDNVWIIIFAAIITYFTRVSGHLILSRFETIHHAWKPGLMQCLPLL